jgi:uncharacterized protein (DUF1330 family)
MSAYLVFIRERTLDAAELEIYWSEIRSTFVGHEVKLLASYGAHEDLEGTATEGTVIAEFPSMEAAKRLVRQPGIQKGPHPSAERCSLSRDSRSGVMTGVLQTPAVTSLIQGFARSDPQKSEISAAVPSGSPAIRNVCRAPTKPVCRFMR